MKTDTPETDQYVKMRASLAYCVERDTAEFARKLERERDAYASMLWRAMQFVYNSNDWSDERKSLMARFDSVELPPSVFES